FWAVCCCSFGAPSCAADAGSCGRSFSSRPTRRSCGRRSSSTSISSARPDNRARRIPGTGRFHKIFLPRSKDRSWPIREGREPTQVGDFGGFLARPLYSSEIPSHSGGADGTGLSLGTLDQPPLREPGDPVIGRRAFIGEVFVGM